MFQNLQGTPETYTLQYKGSIYQYPDNLCAFYNQNEGYYGLEQRHLQYHELSQDLASRQQCGWDMLVCRCFPGDLTLTASASMNQTLPLGIERACSNMAS
uniref:Uncharacterized protein n=1 Tax=Arundo donax TaxID=35708 RepID=A0A0A9ENT6_ARUDO